MDENNLKYRKGGNGNVDLCTNLEVRRIIPRSNNIMGSRRENVIRTIKLTCRCGIIKTVLKILKYLLKLYSPSTAIACNSKIIVIEIDAPASLSVSVKVSSPILGYRSTC